MSALTLTRREGEEVLVGAEVRITVVRSERGRCVLRVEAPREVRVVRAEVDERSAEAARDDAP